MHSKPRVNDVMAHLGVNDVMALETYAPGFMLAPAPQAFRAKPLRPKTLNE